MAQGQSVLERVRHENILRCGAVPRAGFAEVSSDDKVAGWAADLCRYVALHVLGPSGNISFRIYDSDKSFADLGEHPDDLAFLTNSEADQGLRGVFQLQTTIVFQDWISVIVPDVSPVKTLRDLVDRRICLLIGSPGQRAIDRYDREFNLRIARLAFQEDVEMRDAYNAGRCEAVVAARSDLDGLNRSPGINHLHSRAALDLGRDPFYAATPVGDNEWSDLVAGLIAGLLRRSD